MKSARRITAPLIAHAGVSGEVRNAQISDCRFRNAEVKTLGVRSANFFFLVTCALLLCLLPASATTYYVDPAGSNANDGLSPQTPWRTLLKVGISTFQPGDQILFKRDGVWNEWLTPPSSGSAANLIKFDAYGNGLPPEFTGRNAVDFGLIAAGGILASLPPVLLTLAFQRYLIEGLSAGAVKG